MVANTATELDQLLVLYLFIIVLFIVVPVPVVVTNVLDISQMLNDDNDDDDDDSTSRCNFRGGSRNLRKCSVTFPSLPSPLPLPPLRSITVC